ncbi:transposase [Microcoleus sp. F8-D3]
MSVLAIDHTAWLRPHARTLKERTYEHQPTALPHGIPVGIGQGYSTIALIPSMSGSWALPLRHERITSWDNPIGKGAEQLAQVCQYLQHRPIALFDSEYGCAPLVKATAAIAADKLMRIRSNRCLWSTPPAYSGKGRPKIHGQQFKLNDSQTWWSPEQTLESVEPKLGKIRLKKWDDLHFRGSPKHPMTLILVERLETVTGRLNSQPLWLVWVGIQMPSLAEIWQLYLRRFALEHWYRLAKQTLHWNVPKLSTPEQCKRWSDLMPLLTWQLWLAKDVVTEIRLPWQKSLLELTPGRVVQSMLPLLIRIGSPAVSPKRRGNSDGWQTGKTRTPRCRYPVVKKGKGRFQNSSKSIS